ncbi:MAG: hypothetical protein WC812_02355 [Candidatus Pacearchaeota archaeon]|jgi:hypothetical protein
MAWELLLKRPEILSKKESNLNELEESILEDSKFEKKLKKLIEGELNNCVVKIEDDANGELIGKVKLDPNDNLEETYSFSDEKGFLMLYYYKCNAIYKKK